MKTTIKKPLTRNDSETMAKNFIFSKIDSFMLYCRETNETLIYNHRKRTFPEHYNQARMYFDSIHRHASLKILIEKILFGKTYLEKLLPFDNIYYYKMLVRQYNSIVQFCINERHTHKKVSSINIAEIV